MIATDAQVEAGAEALFVFNNTSTPEEQQMAKNNWLGFIDAEKDYYRKLARVVLEAALGIA